MLVPMGTMRVVWSQPHSGECDIRYLPTKPVVTVRPASWLVAVAFTPKA